jgi:hypothetical protein
MRCLLTRAFPEATAKGLVTVTTLDAEDPGISKHWFATGDLTQWFAKWTAQSKSLILNKPLWQKNRDSHLNLLQAKHVAGRYFQRKIDPIETSST